MASKQEREIEELKASAKVVSQAGALLKVRVYGMSQRIAKSIDDALSSNVVKKKPSRKK